MTTLFVADVFFPDTIGGAGRMARGLAEGLAEVEPVIVVSRDTGGLPLEEMVDGLEIHRFGIDSSTGVRFLLSEARSCGSLVRRLRHTRHIDRVVINQPLAALSVLPFLGGLPLSYVFHSPWSEEYRVQTSLDLGAKPPTPSGIWLRRWLEGFVLRRARRVMVLSDFMRGELHRLHHYPDEQIVTIPGGVDLARYKPGPPGPARERFGLPLEAEVILTVRNLVPRMGLPALIEAFSLLAAERPALHLAIAGDGPLRPALSENVANRRLADRVHLLGRIPEEDLPDLYRAADLFVLPTEALEGFGLVTIEALASGVPVVATPVGASPEILRQLDPALVCESAAPSDIVKGVSRFFERKNAGRSDLADRGRKRCESYYGWKAVNHAFNDMVLSGP